MKTLMTKPTSYSPFKIKLLIFLIIIASNQMQSNRLMASDLASLEDYLEMPMENILSIDVVSLFKKTQQLKSSTSAVYIITQDDIRRSGATSIPELLRMVPGINVARISASKWAISSRGFNRLWSNKLLVMKDGQTLYDPLFAGVYWDIQDTILEDIDRIEVIRGPGASLWGSNAVNGVINILTKKPSELKGALISLEGGNRGQKRGSFRVASQVNDKTNMMVYGKRSERGASDEVASVTMKMATAHDAWHSNKIGLALDWHPETNKELSLKAELYDASFERNSKIISLSPFVSATTIEEEETADGGSVKLRWENTLSDENQISLQAYYDQAKRVSGVDDKRDIFDLEFQHSFRLNPTQEIIWGAAYRYYEDEVYSRGTISFIPAKSEDDLYSLFIQDTLSFPEQNLSFVMGVRIERNDYSGIEWQPNVRLAWQATENNAFWAAISRAVHSPSRIENDGYITTATSPYAPVITISGSDSVQSETVIAYELGYRASLSEDFFIDATIFYNDYDKLLGDNTADSICQPSGTAPSFYTCPSSNYLEIPITFDSNMKGQTQGFEIASEYYLTDKWTLKGSYSYLDMKLQSNVGSTQDEEKQGLNPQHQLSIRSLYDISHNINFDLWLRYMDNLPLENIDSYTAIDVRLSWQINKDVELSLVGQNLFDDHVHEFTAQEESIPATFNHRLIYGKLAIKF